MATGHWVTRQGVKDDGRPYSYLVWVVDPVAKPSGTAAGSAAKRSAALARQKAAAAEMARVSAVARSSALRRAGEVAAGSRDQLAAQRRAREVAVATARRAAYERLKVEQAALLRRSRLVRSRELPASPTGSRSAPPSAVPPPRTSSLRPDVRRESIVENRQQKVADVVSVERARWQGRADAWKKQRALNDPTSTAADIEGVLRSEAARGGSADSKSVGRLAELYVARAEDTAVKYKALVDAINAAIDKGDMKTARSLYAGKEFGSLAAEYRRLFGDGSDPTKDGAFSEFWRTYQGVERSQAEWWKRQMQASLDADRSGVAKSLALARADGDTEAERALVALEKVYAGKTGFVADGESPDGRPSFRRRTVAEELQHREALRRMEMEKLRAQYEVQQLRSKTLARAEGLVPGKGGRFVTPGQKHVEDLADLVVRALPGGKAPKLKRAEDVSAFADKIVGAWDDQNRSSFFRGVASSPKSAEYRLAMSAYKAARARFEKEAFGYFGTNSPEWWDRLFQAPGVSHGLAGLQSGVSSIGAGARVLNAAVFGESKIGGFQPNLDHLPPALKAKVAVGRWGGRSVSSGWEQRAASLIREWLATPEGKAWAEADVQSQRAASGGQDLAFADQFYGKGDIGDKLDALNQYGSSPFQNESANLLFQLLADPTNAIPLKFTTYLARAKYASEAATAGSKFLGSSKFGVVRDFLKVDEGTLRREAEVGKLLKKMGADGKSASQLADDLLADVAGIADKGQRVKAMEQRLIASGLSPRNVNATQLFSLIEEQSLRRLKSEGINYVSEAEKIKSKIAEHDLAVKKAAEQRAAKNARARARSAQGLQVRRAEGEAARARVAAAKKGEEVRLSAAVKEESVSGVGAPSVSGAAQEVLGQPPVPAKAVPLHSAAPGKFITPQNVKAKAKTGAVTTKTVAGVPVVVRPAERKLVRSMRVQDPAVASKPAAEISRVRHAAEYYKPDSMGNWLPHDSRVAGSPRYKALSVAAKGGDSEAAAELAKLARERRNIFRREAEDRLSGSPFTQTDYDLAERAGVAGDAKAAANLLTDRETVRHLKRVLGARQTEGVDNYAAEFVRDEKQTIQRDFAAQDVDPSGTRINVGDDLLAARDSIRGVNDAYEVFSGRPDRVERYSGTMIGLVRDASWVKKQLGPKRFGALLSALDGLDEVVSSGGVSAFRDGGQVLFELFHRLRLSGDVVKLKRLSQYVDARLGVLDDPFDSLFGWQWKVMEERAGLPWAWDSALIEDGFMRAAERWNMHPNLALAMIPNGFYAVRAPNRFRLSSALLGLERSPAFRAAPFDWIESDALKAISATFQHGVAGNASRVVHYTAGRFGSFAKGFKLRNRLQDELVHSALTEMSPDALAGVLRGYDSLMPGLGAIAVRLGKSLDEVLALELAKGPSFFPAAPGSKIRVLKRIEYPGVRDAVVRAYWDGKLVLKNAESHRLMLLAHLQDKPTSVKRVVRQFVSYMSDLDQLGEAKSFVREVFRDRIDSDVARHMSEKLGQVESRAGSRSGAGLFDLWDELGFTPDVDRVRSWLDNVQRGSNVAAEDAAGASSGAQRSRQLLEKYENEEEMIRDLVGRGDRDVSPAAYAGTTDPEALRRRVISSVMRFRETKNVAHLEMAVEHLAEASNRALGVGLRAGVSGEEFEAIRSLAKEVATLGESQKLLDGLRREVGDEALQRWLNLTGGVPQYKAALKAAPPADAVPPAPAAPPPVSITPAESLRISESSALLEAVTDMSEEQWWKYLSDRSWKVLRSAKSGTRAKASARNVLDDIKRAQYAKRSARAQAAYALPAERTRYKNRVMDRHGKTAEEMIAPKQIAPYVEDAEGLVVEQGRTYWRTLRSAAPTDAPSMVHAIRHGKDTVDHMPRDVFIEVNERVGNAVAELRDFRADTRTRSRKARRPASSLDEPTSSLTKMVDDDPRIVAVKRKALADFGRETGWHVSVEAYDEARAVLWRGHVQFRSARWLMNRAREVVSRFGGEYDEIYGRLRANEARAEGRRQLSRLAWGEMYGHNVDDVMTEFVARYTDDGQLRSFSPQLTAFRRRTLEEHVKSLSGVDDLDDLPRVHAWLGSRGMPPLNSRDAAREFLIKTGAWSPRRAEQIISGSQSWSVFAEADYWRTSYGQVPAWADEAALRGELGDQFFHDQDFHYAQNREWGIFNRGAEAKLRLSGKDASAIEEAVLHGDPTTGLKGKRELDQLRKYYIDRFGDIVSDGDRLTALPWLMYPDELRDYLAKRTAAGLGIADDLIQSADELAKVEKIISESLDEFWEKYIAPAAADGPVMYEDIFRLGAKIQERLLSDPVWARRLRDVLVGGSLNVWSTFNRALVFSQLSFAVMNVADSPIKGAWYRFSRRGLFNPGLHGVAAGARSVAEGLTPQVLGLDVETTLLNLQRRSALAQFREPMRRGVGGAIERGLAVPRALVEFAPEVSGRAEMAMKMRLAKGMYPTVYSEALAKLGDKELAHAFALKFIKEEVSRMWPTVADAGPLEKLFNRFVPFASYMVKNKVLFLSEALAHPSILNQIEYIGRYIEQANRARWEEAHPGEPMPDAYARRIELPWAPGYYLDLGQFSDATRGLKPLYNVMRGESYKDAVAEWVRLINPSAQAGLYMLTNAMGVTQKVSWRPTYNSDGFVTGYERVLTGWTEPWSKDQPTLGSVFWFLDAAEDMRKLGVGGFTNGELSQLIGKVALFDAIGTPDRGAGLFELYKALRERNAASARTWLMTTPDGELLRDWLLSKRTSTKPFADWYDLVSRWEGDPKRWFHSQDPGFQTKVKNAYAKIDKIRTSYEAKLLLLDPSSAEYRAAKADMLFFISEVYRLSPELMVHEVYSKSASEWSVQLQKWQTSMKTDEFFALDAQRPRRADFATSAAYNQARDVWEHQKEVFLKTYPDVERAIGVARTEYQRVRKQVEAEWDAVLDRIGKRNELIEAAQDAGDLGKADLLYLQNELDFSILEQEHVALYWGADDFKTLPKGALGPPSLRDRAMKNASLLVDFDRRRYEKAVREGRGVQFLADAAYARGMKDVILRAKGGDAFGSFNPAVFVAELKRRPDLLKQYFARNPGKESAWARNDAYISAIGQWGKAARAGNWDAAERLWAKLPQWVKDRYYAKHPEKRQRAAQTAEYMGLMERWVSFFEQKDVKGGMAFFWSMPEWARERYFAKHPGKRIGWEAELKFGGQLSDYFASDPANQALYLESHPELKAWLAKNVSDDEKRRQAVLAAYRLIPKGDQWLRRVYREKYPEIFSPEAKGERRLRSVYDKLSSHPEMLPAFEEWVKAVWASYTEMLRKTGSRPRALVSDHSASRRRSGLSAAETSR